MHMMNVRNSRHAGFKALSVLIALLMVMAMLPVGIVGAGAADTPSAIRIASLSDIHYLDQASMGNKDEGFVAAVGTTNVMQLDGILDSVFAALKKAKAEDGLKYVLIPGDLTRNGEKSAHIALAERLREFEKDSGLPVYVINGNHDINNVNAAQYIEDQETGAYYWEYADNIGPEEFKSIYADFGYDEAVSLYTPTVGTVGTCSYAVELPDGYRLIAIDAGKYGPDSTDSGAATNDVGGNITEELMEWILAQIDEAKEAGQIPLAMTHWNIGDQSYFTTVALQGFEMDNWQEVAETLADAGLHFVFTGHTHDTDLTSTVSDDGEILYNITTCSLGNFPNQYRQTVFTPGADGTITASFEKHECDEVLPVTVDDETYASPFSESSFRYVYEDGDAAAYLEKLLDPLVRRLLAGVADAGLLHYVESRITGADGKPFSLENYFDELLHGGLMIKNQNIITAKNVMGVINDISDQITQKYAVNADYTIGLLHSLIEKLVALAVSDVPCNIFMRTYGFGNRRGGGTMGDLILSVFAYKPNGNEDITDDPFMQDVIDRLESGELARELIDFLKTELVDEILINDVLASVDLNLTTFFVDFNTTEARQLLNIVRSYASGDSLKKLIDNYYFTEDTIKLYNQVATEAFSLFGLEGVDLLGITTGLFASLVDGNVNIFDISIKNIANRILGYGVLSKYGKSISEVEDYFLDKYLTDEVVKGVGYQINLMLKSFVEDTNPQFKGDYDVTYVYAGPVAVEATTENLRKPSLVAPTYGSDASTQFGLSWYTKPSITDSDIEIFALDGAGATPVFTGVATENENITSDCEAMTRIFYGVDFGVTGFLPYELKTAHHTVTLTDLQPDTTYFYRVGSAARGWWSDTGSFTTAAGDNSAFTFFHMTDTQAPSPALYASGWANALAKAFDLYSDAGFVLHTGDHVDNGENFKQWQAYFDTAAENILHTAIMPVSGNHDAFGFNAIVNNFNIDYQGSVYDLGDEDLDWGGYQYTDTGVYYQFDYNNAHFVVLNTNDLESDGSLSEEQLKYLTASMNGSDADWKIVAFHHSVYSNGEHYADSDISGLRKQLQALMPELQVDLVLSGHDHVYFRTEPLNNNKVDNRCEHDVIYDNGIAIVEAYINPDGTIYSVNGTAGVKSYQGVGADKTNAYFPDAAKTYSSENPIFSAITIDDNKLIFRSYSVNGELVNEVDSFGIIRAQNELKRGDANLDGRVNSVDARLALRYAAQLDKLAGDSLVTADVNDDGKVNSIDARLILRVAARLDVFADPYVRLSGNKTNSIQKNR